MRAFLGMACLMTLASCFKAPAENEQQQAGGETIEPAQLAAAPSAPTLSQDAAPSGFCTKDETSVFACTLGNGKKVSVCSKGAGEGRYAYGSSTPELELSGGAFANVMYSGGGESQIAFESEGYSYIVFSRMVRTNFTAGEPNNPELSQGLVLLRGEEFIAVHSCDDPENLNSGINPFTAEGIWERQDEKFTDETARAEGVILK